MKLVKSSKTGKYSVKFRSASGNASRPLGTSNLKEAKEIVKLAKIEELESLAKVGALQRDVIASLVSGSNVQLIDLVEQWGQYKKNLSHATNTIYVQGLMLNRFISESGLLGKGLSDVTVEHIRAFLNPDDKLVGLSQREQRHAALRSLYEFAVASGYSQKDLTKLVAVDKGSLSHAQKEKKRKTYLTEDEYLEILNLAPYFTRQALAICWWTGLRVADVASLEWASWNQELDSLVVWTMKRDKRIVIPLGDELVGGGELRDYLNEIEVENTERCFPQQHQIASDPTRRSTHVVYFQRFLERNDLLYCPRVNEKRGWHTLRRSFVTRCRSAGKSLDEIAIMVGHSSAKTTEMYDLTGGRL